MKNLRLNKKYGIIAAVVIIVLCILVGAGIHKHNEPISPVVGNWAGEEINDYGQDDDGQNVKLQTYNNHTFALEINYEMGTRFNGKYTGTWKKTNHTNNDGSSVYELKFKKSNTSDGFNRDDAAEYFELGGKNHVMWFNQNNNQELRARLNKTN